MDDAAEWAWSRMVQIFRNTRRSARGQRRRGRHPPLCLDKFHGEERRLVIQAAIENLHTPGRFNCWVRSTSRVKSSAPAWSSQRRG